MGSLSAHRGRERALCDRCGIVTGMLGGIRRIGHRLPGFQHGEPPVEVGLVLELSLPVVLHLRAQGGNFGTILLHEGRLLNASEN
ncbi:hypothetical protein A0U90_13700 (plasmid) [Kozakia baliensis]|nr:hypothetical protein A0U90_13700 [Kozakia baliensis]